MGKLKEMHTKHLTGEFDELVTINADLMKNTGYVLGVIGRLMAEKKKFRAVMEYDPEYNKYAVGFKFLEF